MSFWTPENNTTIEQKNSIVDTKESNINSAKKFAEENPLSQDEEKLDKLNMYAEEAWKTFNKNQENKEQNTIKTNQSLSDLKNEFQTPRERFNELNKLIETKSKLYRIEQTPGKKEQLRVEVINMKIERNNLNNKPATEKTSIEDYNLTQGDINEEELPYNPDKKITNPQSKI